MADIPLTDLTTNEKDGNGVFDKLMEVMEDHIQDEYRKNRIQGADYAKVYLGGMQTTLQQAITFLLSKQEADKKAELLAAQARTEDLNSDLVASQIAKTQAEISLMEKQEAKLDQDILVAIQEVEFSKAKVVEMQNQAILTEAQAAKTIKEVEIADYQAQVMQQEVLFSIAKVEQMQEEALLTRARVELTNQQVQTEIASTLVAARQADKLEQDILVAEQEVLNMIATVAKTGAEVTLLGSQNTLVQEDAALRNQQELTEIQNTALVQARASLTTQEETNLTAEYDRIVAQTGLVGAQASQASAETALIRQRETNLTVEKNILDIKELMDSYEQSTIQPQQYAILLEQENKLQAENDLLKTKADSEIAQVKDSWVSRLDNSAINIGNRTGIMGQQKALYKQQTLGFQRDAEQKYAKIMMDSWAVRFSQDPTNNAYVPDLHFTVNDVELAMNTMNTGLSNNDALS